MISGSTVLMFVNGQAMSGGSLSTALSGARFVGPVATAPRYRFFSVRREFPGLYADPEGNSSIVGELYEVSYDEIRDSLLPREPAELELSVIELSDGTGCLSMVMRSESLELPDVEDISSFGGWRKFWDGQK